MKLTFYHGSVLIDTIKWLSIAEHSPVSLNLCVSVFLFVCLSVGPSIRPSVRLCVCLSVCLSDLYKSLYLFMCPPMVYISNILTLLWIVFFSKERDSVRLSTRIRGVRLLSLHLFLLLVKVSNATMFKKHSDLAKIRYSIFQLKHWILFLLKYLRLHIRCE